MTIVFVDIKTSATSNMDDVVEYLGNKLYLSIVSKRVPVSGNSGRLLCSWSWVSKVLTSAEAVALLRKTI